MNPRPSGRGGGQISDLLELCISIDKDFETLRDMKIEKLTYYAVESRYPGFYEPDLEDAQEAVLIAEKVRESVIKKLKLS
ncbi:HEPN domain-containing protein [Thermococcus sp. 101 C5]|uniref:HEPN domain-containing protein n=1 Tax=Thermococcus sp. 101 C5 TaxID=2654197 RepID=UPI0015628242|nr:HEPN domain-containing protein [Thermococcus sp. 101 C5]